MTNPIRVYLQQTILSLLACIFMVGCTGQSIKLTNTELSIVKLIVHDSKPINSNTFMRIDFSSSTPLAQLVDTQSLLQVRVSLEKNGKVLFTEIALGPFSKSQNKSDLNEGINGSSYSALFFKSLSVFSDDTGMPVSIINLDFDNLRIGIVYPLMGFGVKFSSNVISFSKKEVQLLLSGSYKETRILK